ncbi:MAG: chorismate mutase [Micropepsaceae bacterium]
MSKNTETLGEFRAEIDTLDESLHDLLIRRAEITRAIAKVKQPVTESDGKVPPAIRPAREAQIIRHLLSRHKGDLPRRVIVRIWREIISASLQAQTKFHIHVYTGHDQGAFGDLVHAHFGSLTPVREHSRAAAVVQECAEEIDSLGVVPFPEMEQEGVPWWVQLAPPGQAGPRIIAKLPFILHPEENQPTAFAIGPAEHEATGEDTTLIRIETEPGLSRAGLTTILRDAGFEANMISAGRITPGCEEGAILLAVEGFVSDQDPRLSAIRSSAGDSVLRIDPVGGFANPIVLIPVVR